MLKERSQKVVTFCGSTSQTATSDGEKGSGRALTAVFRFFVEGKVEKKTKEVVENEVVKS